MPKLIDSTEVDSTSEAWRHECEARSILRLPTLAERRAWLEAIDHRRGKPEGDRLRATMSALHQLEQDAAIRRRLEASAWGSIDAARDACGPGTTFASVGGKG